MAHNEDDRRATLNRLNERVAATLVLPRLMVAEKRARSLRVAQARRRAAQERES